MTDVVTRPSNEVIRHWRCGARIVTTAFFDISLGRLILWLSVHNEGTDSI